MHCGIEISRLASNIAAGSLDGARRASERFDFLDEYQYSIRLYVAEVQGCDLPSCSHVRRKKVANEETIESQKSERLRHGPKNFEILGYARSCAVTRASLLSCLWPRQHSVNVPPQRHRFQLLRLATRQSTDTIVRRRDDSTIYVFPTHRRPRSFPAAVDALILASKYPEEIHSATVKARRRYVDALPNGNLVEHTELKSSASSVKRDEPSHYISDLKVLCKAV